MWDACGSKRLLRGNLGVEWRRWPLAFYVAGGMLGLDDDSDRRTLGRAATRCGEAFRWITVE